MKITFEAERSTTYPYKVVGAAKLHFVAENTSDEQELRKIYRVYVGNGKIRVEDLPEFVDRNGIKKLTLAIEETVW